MLLQGPKYGIVTLDGDYNLLSNTLPPESVNFECEYYTMTHRITNSNQGEFLLTSKYCAQDANIIQKTINA